MYRLCKIEKDKYGAVEFHSLDSESEEVEELVVNGMPVLVVDELEDVKFFWNRSRASGGNLMSSFSIWREGYSATGNYSPAVYEGSGKGKTFEEACQTLHKNDPYYDKETNSVWGCKLYPTETEARASFG